MSTQQSTVKWFDAKKGYGFIHHPDGGNDIFVHYSQIESSKDFKTLRTGQEVEFELNDGPKGLHALHVNPLDEELASSGEETPGGRLAPASFGEAVPAEASSREAVPEEAAPQEEAPAYTEPAYSEQPAYSEETRRAPESHETGQASEAPSSEAQPASPESFSDRSSL